MALTYVSLEPIVRKLCRLSPLGDTDRAALRALPFQVRHLDAGAYLVREGDAVHHCCALLSGFAYRHRMTGTGTRQILAFQMKGDLLDLPNSMVDCADHGIQMLTAGHVASIPREAISHLADTHPAVARALWRDTLVDASIAREWMMNIGRRSARERVAHLLCEMACREEAAEISEGPIYHMPMTQEQLADATGLTAVHVNRTLQRLRADKLIKLGRADLTVLSRKRLESTADFTRGYLHDPMRENCDVGLEAAC